MPPYVAADIIRQAALGLVPPRGDGGRPPPLAPTVQRALWRSAESMGPAFARELHDISAARAHQRITRDPAALDVVAYHRRFSDQRGLAVDEHVAALERHALLGVLEPLRETGGHLCSAILKGRVSPPLGEVGERILNVAAASIEARAEIEPQHALPTAEALAAAIALRAPSAAAARIGRARAHLLARLGRLADAEAALNAALAVARAAHASSVEAALLVDRARAAELRGDIATALASYDEAITLAPEPGPGDEAAVWAAHFGVAALAAGAAAANALDRGRTLAGADLHGLAALAIARATAAHGPEADNVAAGAITAADRAGDVVLQVSTRMSRARARLAAGDETRAQALMQGAADVARDGLYASPALQ